MPIMSHKSELKCYPNHQKSVHVVASKFGLFTVPLAAMLLLTGCLRNEIDFVFRDDGSATILSRSAVNLPMFIEVFPWLSEIGIECDESAIATDIMTQFEAFGDWATNDVVTLNTSLKEIGNECIGVISEEVPPGTLPNSFDDGVLKVDKHGDGRWSMQLVLEDIFGILMNTYEEEDYAIPDLDSMLEDAVTRLNIRLPGTAMRHNAHTVSSSDSSTEFGWRYKGTEELKSAAGVIHFADTEPGTAQSDTGSTALMVAIAAVVLAASGLLVIRIIKRGNSDSADEASEEA